MVTDGRENQLTKQTGEYLVCAELCRRGFISTCFNGNVPTFDILAVNDKFVTKPIQVKTIRKGNWRFFADDFLNITLNKIEINGEKHIQQSIGEDKVLDDSLTYVFVYLNPYENDEFFIVTPKILQKKIREKYDKKLKECNGVRPKKEESTIAAINREDLSIYKVSERSEFPEYKDKWEMIFE